MCEYSPDALIARREYQRQRYAIRKQAGPSSRAAARDALTEAYREYRRLYYARNPEIHKAAQRRYWEKKAKEMREHE